MTKAVILMRKRPDLSAEDFRRYADENHLPLVSRLPGLQRLVVNYVLAEAQGGDPVYDAIAEDWFETPEAMQAAFMSPEGQAVVADTANFLDTAHLRVLVIEEVEVPVASGAGERLGS
jgi:uncharacterized protein (TIGR02118 family)